jgi:hypothetical protein
VCIYEWSLQAVLKLLELLIQSKSPNRKLLVKRDILCTPWVARVPQVEFYAIFEHCLQIIFDQKLFDQLIRLIEERTKKESIFDLKSGKEFFSWRNI